MATNADHGSQLSELRAKQESLTIQLDQVRRSAERGFPTGLFSGIVALFLTGVGAMAGLTGSAESRMMREVAEAKQEAKDAGSGKLSATHLQSLAARLDAIENRIEDVISRKLYHERDTAGHKELCNSV